MGQIFYTDAQLALEAGEAAMKGKRWAEAAEALEQALALDPACTEAAQQLLEVATQTNDPVLRRHILAKVNEFVQALHLSIDQEKRERFSPGPKDGVYQFQLTLRGIDPPIRRRVQLTGKSTLAKLHRAIQVVMGWDDMHLHEFEAPGGVLYGVPDAEEDRDYGVRVHSDQRVKLYQLFNAEEQQIDYHYDFGDGWEIEIVLEKILPVEEGRRYPYCVDGERAAPPEGVGGILGYEEFLKALYNPFHPEHATYKEWFGDKPFNPEALDLTAINGMLRAVK